MKTAYELAMERLEKESPRSDKKLTDDQKKRLGEVDEQHQAKVAERRIMSEKEVMDLLREGKQEEAGKAREQFIEDMRKMEEERESKKEKIRRESE
ncbi:MAG TPA: hypothetical protein PLZ55_08375 [bacterium]|nr:hypothetical protein [bacterium]HPO08670.1 hypothetical protein [bacterium]HQO34915.1 hypothetical protein [bacterium]HQP98376.1 hypothetical protein [bacterium]